MSTIQNKSKHYTQQSLITIMPIFLICSINVLDDNLFVKGSAIMRFVLISIDIFCFCTSFRTNYFNSIYLAPLEYLSFLEKNTVMELLQYIFSGLTILLPISLNCSLKTCYKFSFHNECSNNRFLCTLP